MTLRGPIAPSIMKNHPLTGVPIEPVGMIGNKVVWPCMGGAPTDDDDDDDEPDDSDSGADDAGKKKKADDDDSGSDGDDDDKVSREDLTALEKRMKAADRRAEAAEKALKAREDEEKGELQKAQEGLKELQEKLDKVSGLNRRLNLQNAFLTANNQKWHDPDTALDLAESKGYLEDVMDEDGVVDKKALRKALESLAKDKPFLVSKDDKKNDDDDDGPSGHSSGGRSDNAKDEAARKQRLKGRFNSIR